MLLSQRCEARPRYSGSRAECHKYAPSLSGSTTPPDSGPLSSPAVSLSIHPIGGFAAVSSTLPLPQSVETELTLQPSSSHDGIGTVFGEAVHCVAAEPHSTFVRVGVVDGRQEVAYEVAVLAGLRRGHRVLQLRRPTSGTRIELAYILVWITVRMETNHWQTPRQVRCRKRSLRTDGPCL